jgi:hypothetical protein
MFENYIKSLWNAAKVDSKQDKSNYTAYFMIEKLVNCGYSWDELLSIK